MSVDHRARAISMNPLLALPARLLAWRMQPSRLDTVATVGSVALWLYGRRAAAFSTEYRDVMLHLSPDPDMPDSDEECIRLARGC